MCGEADLGSGMDSGAPWEPPGVLLRSSPTPGPPATGMLPINIQAWQEAEEATLLGRPALTPSGRKSLPRSDDQ